MCQRWAIRRRTRSLHDLEARRHTRCCSMLIGRNAPSGKSEMPLMAAQAALFFASCVRIDALHDWACAICNRLGRETTRPRLGAPIERARFRRTEAILGGRLLGSGSVCRGFLVYTFRRLCLHGISGRLGRNGVRLRNTEMHSRVREVDMEQRVIRAFAASREIDVAGVF